MKFKMILLLSAGILFISCKATASKLSERNNAKEAEIQIKNIVNSAQTFLLENGYLPGDCYEEMEMRGLIEVKQSIIDAWEFECSWDWDQNMSRMEGTVSATSTYENGAGPGNTVTYTIEENKYTGYGQGNSY